MKLPLQYKFAWRSTRFYGAGNIAIAACIGIAVGIIIGALILGDSLVYSMQQQLYARLGRIQSCLPASNLFRMELAHDIAIGQKNVNEKQKLKLPEPTIIPALRFNAALYFSRNAEPLNIISAAANTVMQDSCLPVTLWGVTPSFAQLESKKNAPFIVPQGGAATINQKTANQLGLKVGDIVIIRFTPPQDVPVETIWGNQGNLIETMPITIEAIASDNSIASLNIEGTQQTACNVFVPLEWLQKSINQPQKANIILSDCNITYNYHPVLDDYGFQLQVSDLGFWNVTSKKIFFSEQERGALINRIQDLFPDKQITLSNTLFSFANQVSVLKKFNREGKRNALNYSFIAATDDSRIPYIKPGLVLINEWVAKELDIAEGEELLFEFYVPDTISGEPVKKTRKWRVGQVIQDNPLALDKNWVPSLPGITDKRSMKNWEAPFPFNPNKIQSSDQAYWNLYSAAPKFYINLEEGRQIFSSRLGKTTAVRVWDLAVPKSSDLAPAPQEVGWTFIPVRSNQLENSCINQSYALQFLQYVFPLIIIGFIFVFLAFRINLAARCQSIGIIQAIGWDITAIRNVFLYESVVVCFFGTLLGLAFGFLLAVSGVWYLNRFALDIFIEPFIQLGISPFNLIFGSVIGFFISFLIAVFNLRKLDKIRSIQRLKGISSFASPIEIAPGYNIRRSVYQFVFWLALGGGVIGAVFFGISTGTISSGVIAKIVFYSGLTILIPGLLAYHNGLKSVPGVIYGFRSCSRRPGISAFIAAFSALLFYLIPGLSVFDRYPENEPGVLTRSNGGYKLSIQTVSPIFVNINYANQRAALGFTPEQEEILADVQIDQAIVRPGADSSAQNLYYPRSPKIIGVSPRMMDNPSFGWIAAMENAFPWDALWKKEYAFPLVQKELIQQELQTDDPDVIAIKTKQAMLTRVLPFIADYSTLKNQFRLSGLNSRLLLDNRPGREVQGRVVAVFNSDIFCGALVTSDDNLRYFFPEVQGYNMFFVQCPDEQIPQVRTALQNGLKDYGVVIRDITQCAGEQFKANNNWISLQQGGIALAVLLGVGVLIAFSRLIIKKQRKELDFLGVIGFSNLQIRRLVFYEAFSPAFTGLWIGSVTGFCAVLVYSILTNERGLSAISFPWVEFVSCILLAFISAWILAFLFMGKIERTRPELG